MPAGDVDGLAAAGYAPEIAVLAERELIAEVKRSTELRDATDPERRAELYERAVAVWSAPAGSGSRAAWLDLRTGGHDGTAVLLSATTPADPSAVIAATAHELGHEVLWGYHLMDRNRPDAEAVTDLFAVFHGFGIFLANQAVERVPGRRRMRRASGTWGSAAPRTRWRRTASAGTRCGPSRCFRCCRPSSTGRSASARSRGSRRWSNAPRSTRSRRVPRCADVNRR
jgi:hypothetical protein